MAEPKSQAPLKFGTSFAPHMVWSRYEKDKGWSPLEVTEMKAFSLMPAASCLHYGQAIFEGIKARRNPSGDVTVFRADQNAKRFRYSASRLIMPELPDEMFIEALRLLLQKDRDFTPKEAGSSLYLRPLMFAEEAFLGVRPADSYIFVVMASPMLPYSLGYPEAFKLWIAETARAAPGGTGDAKAAGNYAAGFSAQIEAKKHHCHQALFLDAKERKYVEEAGAMNIMFVKKDGSVVTPPLNGSILPGVTRDSILTIGRDFGIEMKEEPLCIDEIFKAGHAGEITESFACGTAIGIMPVSALSRKMPDGKIETVSFKGADQGFPVTTHLSKRLLDIQEGRVEDKDGWVKTYA